MKYKAIFLFLVQVLTTIFFFYLIFQKIDIKAIVKNFFQIDVGFISAAIFLSVINYIFTLKIKYKKIIDVLGFNITNRQSLVAKLGILPYSFIFPFKSGKLLRVLYLKNLGMSYKSAFLSFGAEFLFGIAAIVQIFLFGFDLRAFFLFFLIISFVSKYLKKSFSAYIFSNLYEIIRIFSICSVLKSFGIGVGFNDIFLRIPIIIFAAGLPISISGLGVREYISIFLFSGLADTKVVVSAMLFVSFADIFVPTFIGFFYSKQFLSGTVPKKYDKLQN